MWKASATSRLMGSCCTPPTPPTPRTHIHTNAWRIKLKLLREWWLQPKSHPNVFIPDLKGVLIYSLLIWEWALGRRPSFLHYPQDLRTTVHLIRCKTYTFFMSKVRMHVTNQQLCCNLCWLGLKLSSSRENVCSFCLSPGGSQPGK